MVRQNIYLRSILFIAALLSATWILGAPSQSTITVDVPLVSVDVAVFDNGGRVVSNLTREDFYLYEDGVQQNSLYFTPIEAPYQILLLFDCSDSTRGAWALYREALDAFVNGLRSQDRVAVAIFGSATRMIRDWSSPTKQLELGSRPPQCFGQTDFYGALRWASRESDTAGGRNGVVVLTDGLHVDMPRKTMTINGQKVSEPIDAAGDPDFQQLRQVIQKSRTRFYFVATNTDINPFPPGKPGPDPVRMQIRARMQDLADISQGQLIFPNAMIEIVPMYERLARDLGRLYNLAYTQKTKGQGEYRSITVIVRDQALSVEQSRQGYYAR